MGDKPKKGKIAKLLGLGSVLVLGSLAWLLGFHTLQESSGGGVEVALGRLGKHLVKLFLWMVGSVLFFHCLAMGSEGPMASGYGILLALLGAPILFLFTQFLFPGFILIFIPGFHVFLCPQCFQHQPFRFQPVSFKFCFFVTYLCPYCSCLVDAWGGQIFYPSTVPWSKALPALLKTGFLSAATLALAGALSHGFLNLL